MKYSEIIQYKKIIKNMILVLYCLIMIILSIITVYIIKNPIAILIVLIIGGLFSISLEMKLEKQIKEMEILLKLEKLLDRENNKTQ